MRGGSEPAKVRSTRSVTETLKNSMLTLTVIDATPFSTTGLVEPDPHSISCPEWTSLDVQATDPPARFVQLKRTGSPQAITDRQAYILDGHERRLKSCVEAWRVWEGNVSLSTTVTKSGRVDDVSVVIDGHAAERVTACVANHVQIHTFPEGPESVRIVQEYTITEQK